MDGVYHPITPAGTGEHLNSGWSLGGIKHKQTTSYFFLVCFSLVVFLSFFFSFTPIDDIQTIPPLTPSSPQGVNTASSSLHGGVDHEIDGNNDTALTGKGSTGGGFTASEPARLLDRRAL